MTLAVIALLACQNEHTEQAPVTEANDECREGFLRQSDGHCYPTEPIGLEEALRNLPTCEPVANDGALDLVAGCASGACWDMTWIEINAALDETGLCYTTSWSDTRLYCDWSIGLEGVFYDDDENEVPDEISTNIADRIHLFPPYDRGTLDGSGVGANPRCFVDELGIPDYVSFHAVDGELRVSQMNFDAVGLVVHDRGADDTTEAPNGYLDEAYLYGAPEE